MSFCRRVRTIVLLAGRLDKISELLFLMSTSTNVDGWPITKQITSHVTSVVLLAFDGQRSNYMKKDLHVYWIKKRLFTQLLHFFWSQGAWCENNQLIASWFWLFAFDVIWLFPCQSAYTLRFSGMPFCCIVSQSSNSVYIPPTRFSFKIFSHLIPVFPNQSTFLFPTCHFNYLQSSL